MGNWPKYKQNVKLQTCIVNLQNVGKYGIDTGLPCSLLLQLFALLLTSVDTKQKRNSHHTPILR